MATNENDILRRIRRYNQDTRSQVGRPEEEEDSFLERSGRFGRSVVKGAIDAPLALLEGAGKVGSQIDRAIGIEDTPEETGAATRLISRARDANRRFFEAGGTTGADTAGEIVGSLVGFGGAYRQAGKALSGALTSSRVARAAQGTGRASTVARGAEALGKTNRFWPSRLREGVAGAPLTLAMDLPEQESSTAYNLGSLLEGGDEWNDPIARSLISASETPLGRAATGLGFDMMGDVAVSSAIEKGAKALRTRQPRMAHGGEPEEPRTLRRTLSDAVDPTAREERRSAKRAAEIDSMTGVGNRAALDKALPAAEADEGMRVIAFDANNFGQINKKVSQEAGDEAIRSISAALSAASEELGAPARVFRRGGDEFVILAPAEVADQVRARAEEIYGSQRYGDDLEVSLSGTVGNTFAEADGALQARKAERKGATPAGAPAPAETPAAPRTRLDELARAAEEAELEAQRLENAALTPAQKKKKQTEAAKAAQAAKVQDAVNARAAANALRAEVDAESAALAQADEDLLAAAVEGAPRSPFPRFEDEYGTVDLGPAPEAEGVPGLMGNEPVVESDIIQDAIDPGMISPRARPRLPRQPAERISPDAPEGFAPGADLSTRDPLLDEVEARGRAASARRRGEVPDADERLAAAAGMAPEVEDPILRAAAAGADQAVDPLARAAEGGEWLRQIDEGGSPIESAPAPVSGRRLAPRDDEWLGEIDARMESGPPSPAGLDDSALAAQIHDVAARLRRATDPVERAELGDMLRAFQREWADRGVQMLENVDASMQRANLVDDTRVSPEEQAAVRAGQTVPEVDDPLAPRSLLRTDRLRLLPKSTLEGEVPAGAASDPAVGAGQGSGEIGAPGATGGVLEGAAPSRVTYGERTFQKTKKGWREVSASGTGLKGRTFSDEDLYVFEREAQDPAYREHRDRARQIQIPHLLIERAKSIARRAEAAVSKDAQRLLAREAQAFLDEADARGLTSQVGFADVALLKGIVRAGMGATFGALADEDDRMAGALAGAAVGVSMPAIGKLVRPLAERGAQTGSLYANPLLDPDLYLAARRQAVKDYLLPQEAMSTGRFGFAADMIRTLEPEQQVQFTREVNDALLDPETGQDLVWRAAGGTDRPLAASDGEGLYMGDVTPNRIYRADPDVGDDVIARYSALKGLLMGQDAMVWSRWVPEGTPDSGLGYVLSGDEAALTTDVLREMVDIIKSDGRYAPLSGATYAEGSIFFRNFDDGVPEEQYKSLLMEVIDKVQSVPTMGVGEGHFTGAYYDGPADYLSIVGRDADTIQQAHDLLLERVAPVFNRWLGAAGGDQVTTRARIHETLSALDATARGVRNQVDMVAVSEKGGRTNLEVARELRAKNPDIYELPWEEQRPRLLRVGLEDIRQAREELAHGGDWYDGSLADAYALLPIKIPETRDPDHRAIFSMILAITSNNADVNPNWSRAIGIFNQFVQRGEVTAFDAGHPMVDAMRLTNAERLAAVTEGRLPEDPGKLYAPGTKGSDKDWTIDKGLRKLDALLKERGVQGIRDHLIQPKRKGVRGFGGYEIPMAGHLFGEKVGPFMSNVEGLSQYVTADKWMKRTWDGWMGRVHEEPVQFPVRGQKGKYETRVDPTTGETVKQLNDVVSPIEHAQIADVVQTLARQASEEFGEEISPSAVQGLLWYLEKHRYSALGAVESASESFHDAAVNNLLGKTQKRAKSTARRQKTASGVALATALTNPEALSAATGAAAGAASEDEGNGVVNAALLGAAVATGLGGRRLIRSRAAARAAGGPQINGIGFVAPPTGPGGRATKAMEAFFRRNMTSTGDLPEEVFKSKIRGQGWIESQVREMSYTVRDFENAAKEAYGGVDSMTDADIGLIDNALKGQAPLTSVPVALRPVVTKMRTHIDALSRRLIDDGVVQGPLAATIDAGLGVYAKRSYRIFDDPNWATNVPQDVKNRAIAYVRQEYPNASQEEVDGIIAELLVRGEQSPVTVMQNRRLGSKAMNTLTSRKDIHPSIRALWGEYGEAQINYSKSVASMSQLIGNHQILMEARDAGMGKWLFDGPIVKGDEEYAVQIAAEGSKAMAPLNGLYTSKAIRDAFSGAFDSPTASGFLRAYMKANGAVKVAKTVLSPQAQIRNLIGNTGFAVANGHVRGGKMIEAFRTVVNDMGGTNYQAFRDKYRKYLEHGVVASGTTEGELRDIVRDASKQGVSYLTGPMMGAPAKAMKTSMDWYRASDDLWKIFAFENEVSRYRSAYPGWTTDQVERTAAEIVRNTYPNYDMVPQAIKFLRRVPLVGTFTSFPAEVVRVGFHTLGQAAKELKDPQTRAIGMQRAAGILAAATLTSAAAITTRQLVGVTPEEEKDMRRYLAPWDKHSQFFHLGKDERGNRRFINMGYTDPYSFLREPAIALMSGDDWETKLWSTGMMLAEPFFGEEILAGRLVDVSRNKKKDTGGQVYNEQADLTTRFNDSMLYVAEAFEPGLLTQGRRIYSGVTGEQSESGRVYNAKDEVLSVATGQRRQAVDIRQGMRFKARDFQEGMTEAQRIINRTLTDRSNVTAQEVASAYAETEMARRRLFDTLHEDVQAGVRMGLSYQEAYDILSQGGVSQEMAQRIIRGVYEPYKPSKQFIKSMARSWQNAAATREEKIEGRDIVVNRVRSLRDAYQTARAGGE